MAKIKVYGAPWCPDCKRSKKFLAEHRVPYEWIDIDEDAEGLRLVEAARRNDAIIAAALLACSPELVLRRNDPAPSHRMRRSCRRAAIRPHIAKPPSSRDSNCVCMSDRNPACGCRLLRLTLLPSTWLTPLTESE